jgi:transcriptional regulator with XRE-family HTH domain
MGIGNRLRLARKSRGFTQDSLANSLGVSRGVITNIEYEKTQPQLLVIRAICDLLCINEEWLIHGSGEMEKNQDIEKSARILSDIYQSAKELSEEELDYILDMIKTFQKHREKITIEKSAHRLG